MEQSDMWVVSSDKQDIVNSYIIIRAIVSREILLVASEDSEDQSVLLLFQKIPLLVLSVVRIANDHAVAISVVSSESRVEETSLIITQPQKFISVLMQVRTISEDLQAWPVALLLNEIMLLVVSHSITHEIMMEVALSVI